MISKKGSGSDIKNYKPISRTSCIIKLHNQKWDTRFESPIRNRMIPIVIDFAISKVFLYLRTSINLPIKQYIYVRILNLLVEKRTDLV